MSRRFWTGMLRKAIVTLLGRTSWADVQYIVSALMDCELSGEEKRRLAFAQLRSLGVEVATWLLSAAIEVAYGELKEKTDAF